MGLTIMVLFFEKFCATHSKRCATKSTGDACMHRSGNGDDKGDGDDGTDVGGEVGWLRASMQ